LIQKLSVSDLFMALVFSFFQVFDHALSNAPSPFSTAVCRLFQAEEKTNNLGF
jgi:hypothetical protein